MASRTWPGTLAVLAGVAWLFQPAGPAQAQDPDVKALLRRMDRLEKQNEDLQKSLQAQQELIRRQQEELKRSRPGGASDGGDGAVSLKGDAVKKMINDYLKEKDDKKKAEDDKKKAEDDAKKKAEEAVKTYEVGKDLKMSASWRDGFYAETADKAFTFHVGGRVDYDLGWYGANHAVSNSIGAFNNFIDPNNGGVADGLQDGENLRRVRLRFDGTFYEVMNFVAESEFSNFIDLRRRTLGVPTTAGAAPPAPTPSGTPFEFEPPSGPRFTDVWLGTRDLPYIGNFRAGHQKELLMFANATGSRYLTFMERPLIFDAFNDDYQYAVGLADGKNVLCDRASYWFGWFRNTNPFTNDNRNGGFDTGDGQYVFDTRLTFLPVWLDDGKTWVHVGADYSYRNLHDDVTRFRTLPQVRTGVGFEIPTIINTGAIFSTAAQQNLTLEFASVWGPFTLAAEYSGSLVRNAFTGGLPAPNGKLPTGVVPRGDYVAQGYYVEVLYFLTNAQRTYDLERRGYGRVRPAENFFFVHGDHGPLYGLGAWEVGVRYDYLDLSNHGINGGFEHAITAGVNWHLNPNAKVQWNYVWTERNFAPTNTTAMQKGDFNAFGMQFHWDF